MPLSATVLEAVIDTKLSANPSYADWTGRSDFRAQVLKAIAEGVVEHITSAAVVNVTSVSGVTTGGGTSGPGTGTIT